MATSYYLATKAHWPVALTNMAHLTIESINLPPLKLHLLAKLITGIPDADCLRAPFSLINCQPSPEGNICFPNARIIITRNGHGTEITDVNIRL